jgi:hypothetical protein
VDVSGLLQTQSTLLVAMEGMDVHVGQIAQCLDVVEDRQEAQAVDVEEGRCRCGTLVESVPMTEGPGSLFKGFEGPWSEAVTEPDKEVLPPPMVEEMRVWAGIWETEPEVSRSSAEVEGAGYGISF